MKIAYVINHSRMDAESGILRKVAQHIRYWRARGHEVCLFALSGTRAVWEGLADVRVEVVHKGAAWQRPRRLGRLIDRVVAWSPDIVFMRFEFCYAGLVRLARAVPVVVEHNTLDVEDLKLMLPRPAYWYHCLNRRRFLSEVSGMVAVCGEIAAQYRQFGAPIEVISNGLPLDEYPVLPAPANAHPRLVLIGWGDRPWHGADKVVTMARCFPDWHFDIVGCTPGCARHEIPPNITCHGLMSRAEFEPLMQQADVGLGTLALHRKHMDEVPPLKVREYLAYGLPVIIAYRDPDFPTPVDFLLQLPNTEQNVAEGLDAIEAFVERRRGTRVPRAALAHLDTSVKETQRLAFFERVLEREAP